MVERRDIEFEVERGVRLRGWLFSPPGAARASPAITMAHGYGGSRHHGLERFARLFAHNGFAVMVHDHRGFGTSDGVPRHDVDPWRQVSDWRSAISYLERLEEVDPERIGLWGTSYAGGHAMVLGATDRRLRCVVAQVPTTSGVEQGLRRIPPEQVASIEAAFVADDRAQACGGEPARQAIVGADPNVSAAYRSQDAIDFYLQPDAGEVWKNNVTLRSARAARMYEPGAFVARVSPTPLLMVAALHDSITLTDLALTAYERALQPKRLVTIPGGHFDPYGTQFDRAATAALDWFTEHLNPSHEK